MRPLAIGCLVFMFCGGVTGFALGQDALASAAPKQQVQLNVVVAQVNRAAALQLGLMHSLSANQTGGSCLVNGECAERTLHSLRNLGLAKVLANPSMITLNGRPAEFHVGGEAPYGTAEGGVNFRAYGTRVALLPVVQGDGRLRLQINVEVSKIDPELSVAGNGIVAPGFDTRTLATTTELRSGETLALNGLSDCNCEAKDESLPLLAYLPVLGRLAGFGELTPENSVYLLLVTPQLIPPVAVKDQFQFDMRICEGDPDGSREAGTLKVLANPTLVTLDNRTADFFVGGELAALSPEGAVQFVEFGTQVSVLARSVDDTWVHLDMKLEKTDRTDDPDPSVLKVAGHTSRTVGKFKLGEPVRMLLDKGNGKKLWCDVTVTKANP
jgi:Flp pilus assembly secretin CpaC